MPKPKFQHKDGYGALFRNKPREDENGNLVPLHPDAPKYRGTAMWRGEEIKIGLWNKETQEGELFLSLKLSEPDRPRPAPERRARRDEDIPF